MQNLDVGDEQIGVMIELKCRGWIEMIVVSSRKDVAPVWMCNHCLSWVRCGWGPTESSRVNSANITDTDSCIGRCISHDVATKVARL